EVVRINLDPDELAAHLDAGNAGCAGAHKGVQNSVSLREETEAPLHQWQRILCRVKLTFGCQFAVREVECARWLVNRRPSHFNMARRKISDYLVPYQPAANRRKSVVVATPHDCVSSNTKRLWQRLGRLIVPCSVAHFGPHQRPF